MEAIATLDVIVAGVWVGGLTMVLLCRAVLAWLKYRHAVASAQHAKRLFLATRPRLAEPPAPVRSIRPKGA